MLKKNYIRTFASALLAAVTWGGWAYLSNFDAPSLRTDAAISQAAFSFLFTLAGVGLLEFLYAKFDCYQFREFIAVGIVSTLSLFLMVLIHTVIGTPNKTLTILPVFLVSLGFCTVYVVSLNKMRL